MSCRIYPGTAITLTNSVRVAGVLTDADDITFWWKMGLTGTETSVAPTHDGTGLYSVVVIPLIGGNLYYRWDTEGALDTASEGVLSIANSQFTVLA